MASQENTTHKPRKIALGLLIAFFILLAGVYALRSVLIAPYAIAFLENTIEARLGLKISIGGLDGSYFSDIKVKNVTTVRRRTGSHNPLSDLQLRRLKLTYQLEDLFGGLSSFLAGTSIDLEGARVSIDLTGERGSDDHGKALNGFFPSLRLPRIRIRNSSVRIKGTGYETRFDGVSVTARSSKLEKGRLQLRVAQWSLNHPDLRNIAVSLETDISYSSENLLIENLLADEQLIIKSATIGLGGIPNQIPFKALFNLAGGNLDASGRVAAKRLQLAVSGSDIELSRISKLLSAPALTVGGRLSLQGHLSLLLSDPRDMASDFQVRVVNGSVRDTTVEQLVFRFRSDGRHLRVEDLQLTTAANRISISRASVPVAAVYGADLDAVWRSLAVDWRLEGTDIPALLKLAGVRFQKLDDRMPVHRLALNGRMTDGKLMIPDGRLEVDGGHILLEGVDLAMPIGGRTLTDSPLAGELSVDLPQVEVLSRIFALPSMGGAVKGRINVSGTLRAPEGAASISGQALTYRNATFGNLSIQAKADLHSVVIESAVLQSGNDRAIGRGRINLAQRSFENVEIEFSVADLEPYFSKRFPLLGLSSLSIPKVHGGLEAAIRLAGPFDGPAGSLNLHARRIRINGAALGEADVDLMFSADRLEVLSAVFSNRNDRLQLNGSIRLRQKQLDEADVQIAVSDLSVYQPLWAAASMDVSGSLQGRLHADGDLRHPDAEAGLQLQNFRFNDLLLENGSVQLFSTGRRVGIQSAELSMQGHRLQLAGDIRRNSDDTEFEITLQKAAISGQDTLLALERPQKCRLFRNGRMIFDQLAFSGSAGRISVSGAFDPHHKSDLLIRVAGLRSGGWLGRITSDRIRFQGLDAQIKISGRSDTPLFTVMGSLDRLGSRDLPVALSGKFNLAYGDRYLKIHEFVWSGRKGQQIFLEGSLPLDPFAANIFAPGQLELTGRSHITDARVLDFVFPWAEDTGGSIHCELALTGTWAHPAGTLQVKIKDMQRPGAIKPLPPGPYSVSGTVRIDGNLVSLKRLEASSAGWRISAKGQWVGAPSPADVFRSQKRKLTGQVNAEGALTVSDLHWLAQEVSGIRRISGGLEAVGSLRGPITAPTADAKIKLSDAELSPDFDMPALQNLNMEASVTPTVIAVQKFTGELGGAPFELAGTLKTKTGPYSEVDFRLRGENILLYRNESGRLRADTRLVLKGPAANMALSGDVAVTDGGFFKNFGVIEGFEGIAKTDTGSGFHLFSIRKPPFKDLRFNIRITAKEPFLIRNNLAKGSVRPDLVLTGTGELPLLVGKVYVEPTRLYLPAGRMNLQAGLIRFERTAADRPNLDLLGTATLRSYDITAVIDGPYDEPVVTLSSVPPLPDDELLMLLLTGKPPKSSGARSGGMTQGLNVAMFVGRDLTSRLFAGQSDETVDSIIDRFDVEVGRSITQRGEETIHSQFRLADDIFLDGDSLYLTGERDYFDYYNGGIKLVFRFR